MPPPDSRQVDAWVIHGYLSDTRRAVEHHDEVVALPDGQVPLQWILPAQGSALPLVVYLPGLGESTRDGVRWREAWAAAGYAVLAVASGPEDRLPARLLRRVDKPEDGTPPPANAQELRQRVADLRDELHEWARQRFEPAVAAARVQRLVAVLTAVQARAAGQQDALLARVNLQQVVLAGYDSGAYTALLAVGEMPRAGWTAPALPVAVKAVVALSPFADFGGTGFGQRYSRIQVPVLSVSGGSDVDGAGVVPSSFVRRAPFENLPGHASLLWLRAGNHAMLSGTPEDSGARGPAGEPGGGGKGRDNPGGRGSAMRPGSAGYGAAPGEESEASRARQATDYAIDQVIVAATTTAFLDAEMKQDPLARQWLAGEAQRWIKPRGEWLQR